MISRPSNVHVHTPLTCVQLQLSALSENTAKEIKDNIL